MVERQHPTAHAEHGIRGTLQPVKEGQTYTSSLDLSIARNYNNRERDPDIPIKCNTFIILQQDLAAGLKIAWNRSMFDSPVTVSQSPYDNLMMIRSDIEGIWVSNAAGSAGNVLKIAYGNNISISESAKSITTLTLAQNNLRYGRNVTPTWQQPAEVTAPAGNTVLATKAVGAAVSGYIYGVFIAVQEANDFLLKWVSGGQNKQKRYTIAGQSTFVYTDVQAINEGWPADTGTNITIQNVNAAAGGKIYQADFLEGEV